MKIGQMTNGVDIEFFHFTVHLLNTNWYWKSEHEFSYNERTEIETFSSCIIFNKYLDPGKVNDTRNGKLNLIAEKVKAEKELLVGKEFSVLFFILNANMEMLPRIVLLLAPQIVSHQRGEAKLLSGKFLCENCEYCNIVLL